MKQTIHFVQDRGLFLAPFQFLDGVSELLIGELQVLLRLPGFGHVPADTGEMGWARIFPRMDFCARIQKPDGPVAPHRTEFRVEFCAIFDRSGDGLLDTLAVVGVYQRCKPRDGLRESTGLKAEKDRALLIGLNEIQRERSTSKRRSRRNAG